jgi:catechol 2,3-dioxygenase-like lactoylglutathione lyase family enzyme
MTVQKIDHVNLSVGDLAETVAFYQRIFGFEVVERGVQPAGPWCILRCGDAMLCLYQTPDREHLDRFALADHRLHGLNHFALRITDRAAWLATVEREGLELRYGGAVTWPHSTSWYFKDPTGYEIEVASWDDDGISFAHAAATV